MTEKIITSGKRKRAIARSILVSGEGKIKINGKSLKELPEFDKLRIKEPLEIAKKMLGSLKFNVEIKVQGGGEKGQIDAARIALARGIIQFSNSKDLEKAYLDYDRNLLVADVRRKEAYKPGDSKARKKRQSSKR